ncbi:phage portal protein [Bosea minatitlanensis]|uniref:Phage portal protein n=1 Tax=Bosea minatitlanensis TaxID=128782 RepID=A0ABW0F1D8_9HYPH|nr:phage portal protein [Bosea minatitlanensis]MCT4492721.1 phage portal protein [Bosea minatitlanensis]
MNFSTGGSFSLDMSGKGGITLDAGPNAGPLQASSSEGWDMFDVGWDDLSEFLGLGGLSRGFGIDAVGMALAIQCADVKARDISKTEMMLWRRENRQWSMVEPREHWFAKLLARKPNSVHGWVEFWRMVVLHLELAQNAYILPRITRRGEVTELIPIMPARCRPRVSPNGSLFYEIAAATEFERSQIGDSYIIVPASRIIHLRGRLWDGLMGLSNQILGSPTFQLLRAINDYQTGLFGNDGKQPLVFETDHVFGNSDQSDAAFQRLKRQLTERSRKQRANGDPILLEAGLKAKAIAIDSQEAATTQTYNQQVMRVCGLMQTPPHKIFAYESVKYDNMAAADAQYANDCLVPIACNIEEKFRNALLTEDEWDTLFPEFDREMMVAGDVKAQNERIKVGMQTGLMEFDEGRARLGLNPLGGKAGRHRLIPVNMALVDEDGEIVAEAADGQPNNDGETERTTPRLAVDNS